MDQQESQEEREFTKFKKRTGMTNSRLGSMLGRELIR